MFGDLWFEDYVKIENNIWFAAGNYNGLYKFNLVNKEVRRVAIFPEEPMISNWAFRRVRLWNGEIIFLPAYANAVYMFDVRSRTFKKFDILEKEELSEYQSVCKFQCYEIYGDWLYIIGFRYPGIIKVNLKNHQVKKITNIPSAVFTKNTELEEYFGNEVVAEKNILYITCPSSNKILMLDMEKDSFEVTEVGSKENGYDGIYEIDGVYYLIVYNSDNIVWWDQENGKCGEIEIEFDRHFCDRKICMTQNYFWVFSYVSNEVVRIDKKDKSFSKILLNHSEDKAWLVFCQADSNGIYFLNMYSGEWHFLKEDGTDENLHFIIKEPDKEGVIKQLLQDDQIKKWDVLYENSAIPIDLLFFYIVEDERKREKKNFYDNYGKMIYETMVERCGI